MVESKVSPSDPLQTLVQAQKVAGFPWRTHLLSVYSTSQGVGGCLKRDRWQ
jgi:hypothetical protein